MNIGYFKYYIFIWSAACILALIVILRNSSSCVIFRKSYFLFLSKPWKIITFMIATASMTLMAPFSGDYTWDYYDALSMSFMTFYTAPWAVGIFYRFFKRMVSFGQMYAALCIMFFVSSWFYDLYILLRDGFYPPTWLHNLLISSTLFFAAGLFWNLDWEKDKGVVFAFQWDDWIDHPSESKFLKIILFAFPLMFFVFIILAMFLFNYFYAFIEQIKFY
jgi:hypothetical protein